MYEKIEIEENTTSESSDDHIRRSTRKFPWLTTIILSTTTLVFGVNSLHQALQPTSVCPASSFESGWETEWGTLSRVTNTLVHQLTA